MGVIETLILTTALAGIVGTGLGGLIGAMLQKDSNRTVSLLLYLPIMILCSIVTGLFTGLCAQFLVARGEKLWKTTS